MANNLAVSDKDYLYKTILLERIKANSKIKAIEDSYINIRQTPQITGNYGLPFFGGGFGCGCFFNV